MAPVGSDVLKPVASKQWWSVRLHNQSLAVMILVVVLDVNREVITPSDFMRSPLYVYVLKKRLKFTAILYWTYRAELTNDPNFRVNQK